MAAFPVTLAVLALLLVLLLVSMWLPVRVRFHATFAHGRLRYRAEFRPPLLPWYLEVPGLRSRRRASGLPEAGPSASPAVPAEETGAATNALDKVKTFVSSVKGSLARFEESYPKLRGSLSMALRSVRVAHLSLRAAVGTGDAYETALLAGSLRALSSIGVSVARRKGLRFEERPHVSVRPVYHRQHLSAELRVVVSVVPWRALVAAVASYRQFKQVHRRRPAVSKSSGWNTKA